MDPGWATKWTQDGGHAWDFEMDPGWATKWTQDGPEVPTRPFQLDRW